VKALSQRGRSIRGGQRVKYVISKNAMHPPIPSPKLNPQHLAISRRATSSTLVVLW